MDNEKQDSLIPFTPTEIRLQRVGNLMKISDGLLLENSELLEFCLKHPEFFFTLISRYYPLKINQIIELEESINFSNLSANRNSEWSVEIIEKYFDKWNWEGYFGIGLSGNDALPWSIELIEKFKNKWGWLILSSTDGIPWSIELIDKFKNELNHKPYEFSRNQKWYEDINRKTELLWSVEFIEKYYMLWDLELLCKNPSLPWSIDFIIQIDELTKKMDSYDSSDPINTRSDFNGTWWYYLCANIPSKIFLELSENLNWKLNWMGLSINENLPWSIEFFEKYINKWDWNGLSQNEKFPWSIELIEAFKNNWNWFNLSRNKKLSWSIDLIEKYSDKWEWGHRIIYVNKYNVNEESTGLNENDGLPMSLEIIERFQNKWYWNYLGQNKSIPWSIELIEKFKTKWYWGGEYSSQHSSYDGLSLNTRLPWSIEFIEQFEDKWDWNYLRKNEGLPWSLELIKKFEDKLHIEGFEDKFESIGSWCGNLKVWDKVFKNKVNDEFIKKVVEKIKES